jgi:hypothetical protein
MTAVRLLHGRGIDPLFYRLHVAIDNVSTGHGGLALRAIKSYLADKKEEGGDQAVQEHWRRIWLGYVTWDTVGFDSKGWLERYLQVSKIQVNVGTEQTKVRWPDVDEYFRGRMRALIRHKAPIASTVHGAKMLGGRLLNELFADPADLMRRLENSAYVDKRRPSQSRLLRLMDFDGPMYKVFSPDEREVIVDWIETLHAPDDYPLYEPLPDDEGTPVDPAVAMTVLIEQLAPRATTAHGGITLAEPGTATATPLADLFADAKRLMAALAHCGYVVPGQPLRSILMLVLTAETSPMRGVLSSAQVEVVRAWIEAGAELPKGAAGAKSIASLMASPGPGAQELLRRRVGTDLPGNVGLKSIH